MLREPASGTIGHAMERSNDFSGGRTHRESDSEARFEGKDLCQRSDVKCFTCGARMRERSDWRAEVSTRNDDVDEYESYDEDVGGEEDCHKCWQFLCNVSELFGNETERKGCRRAGATGSHRRACRRHF